MRIAVDVSPLSRPRTGVGTYLRGMLVGLAAALSEDDRLVGFAVASARGRRAIEADLGTIPLELRTWSLPYPHAWRAAWGRLGAPTVERLLGPLDVLHVSDWSQPPQRGGVRATTVYDLVAQRFPEWTTARTRRMAERKLADAVRRCDVLFAISEYTAADAVERLGVERPRVRVALPGVDPRYRPDGEREQRGGEYVLAVGTLEPRKNLAMLLQAFSLLSHDRPELELLVAGPAGWGDTPDLVRPGVVALGRVGEERLSRLYRGACALAYPSWFEGFGLPVVEAMACGTPVVASSHPSLDEACGTAALRADPRRPEDLAAGLARALDEPGDLRRAGLEHARRFTWEACGRAVLEGYRAAAV